MVVSLALVARAQNWQWVCGGEGSPSPINGDSSRGPLPLCNRGGTGLGIGAAAAPFDGAPFAPFFPFGTFAPREAMRACKAVTLLW